MLIIVINTLHKSLVLSCVGNDDDKEPPNSNGNDLHEVWNDLDEDEILRMR